MNVSAITMRACPDIESARLFSDGMIAVPLRVIERGGIPRVQEPVTVGVPLPKGACLDDTRLQMRDQHGRPIPVQTQVLARWSDGSLKWVLLDFQATVEAHEEVCFRLGTGQDAKASCESAGMSVRWSGERVTIDTGPARFFLSQTVFRPFDGVVVDGGDVCGGPSGALVVTDGAGIEYLPYIDDIAIETAGQLRTTVRVAGKLRRSGGEALADFFARVTCFAGRSDVRLEWTIRNSRAAVHPRGLWDLGDPRSIYFKDCTLHLALMPGSVESIEWSVDPRQPLRGQGCRSFELYQDSSGGEQWQSANHVNRFGAVTTSFRGYRITLDGVLASEGHRASPTIRIRAGALSLSAAVLAFWENFPKAIEAENRGASIRLFPRQYGDVFELQPGEQKTHTVFVHWTSNPDASLAWTHAPLIVTPTPEWYETTKAIPHLAARRLDATVSVAESSAERLVDTVVEGDNTFFARRERIDEYGWRHFGDLYADHEAVKSSPDRPLVAHYNNQYDVLYGSLVQFARSGNPRWYDLARDLARHVIDIDLYHTNEDRPALNGGLFWHTDHYTDAGTATHRSYSITSPQATASPSYGGGPACEHNYASGLLHYYYLTGDPGAREAVVSLADWVVRMDDGSSRFMGWLDRRPTGYCSVTATAGYHGPGRGSGNSISVLLDGWNLTGERRYLVKAETLIKRCIHPKDDIALLHLDDIERRWSYTVFLQVLGKYLDVKSERGELDEMYAYARASLLHYASWMAEHEVPYMEVMHRVLIPTETWPAQDMRKANVFCAAARHATADKRALFLSKADFFFERSVSDLQSFDTHTLTRPLVLLMTNAYVYSYCRRFPNEGAPAFVGAYDFGVPQRFKPQFHELYCFRDWLHRIVRSLQAVVRRSTAQGRGHA
jgi:hypothetical protein